MLLSCENMNSSPRCKATRNDEHAVSTGKEGPENPKKFETLPAAVLNDVPDPKNGSLTDKNSLKS